MRINKKGYKPNYFADIVIPGIILAFVMIFFMIFFRGTESSIDAAITVGEIEVANQENLLVFLRMPIEVIEEVTVFVVEETEGEVRDFSDGTDSTTFNGIKELIFDLEDIRYTYASFDIEGESDIVIDYRDGTRKEMKSPATIDFTSQIHKECEGECKFFMTLTSNSQITVKNIRILGQVVSPGIVTQEKKIMKPTSQVIIDSFNKKSFTSIQPKMQEFVDKLSTDERGYQLLTKKMPLGEIGKRVSSSNFAPGNSYRLANVTLPLIDPHTWVEIHLYESMPE